MNTANSETQTQPTTLFVANLAPEAGERELRLLFERFGAVSEARLVADSSRVSDGGHGYVTMTAGPAGTAIKELNDSAFMGKKLRVTEAEASPSASDQPQAAAEDEQLTAHWRPHYQVISVEKAAMPSGGEGSDWHRYILSSGRSQITGLRRGTHAEVDAYARHCADEYNERFISGKSKQTMAPMKKGRSR